MGDVHACGLHVASRIPGAADLALPSSEESTLSRFAHGNPAQAWLWCAE